MEGIHAGSAGGRDEMDDCASRASPRSPSIPPISLPFLCRVSDLHISHARALVAFAGDPDIVRRVIAAAVPYEPAASFAADRSSPPELIDPTAAASRDLSQGPVVSLDLRRAHGSAAPSLDS